MLPGDEFYLAAFNELSTTRAVELGPIPWHHIISYAEQAELDEEMSATFHAVIRAMDAAHLTWTTDEAEKRRKQGVRGSSR